MNRKEAVMIVREAGRYLTEGNPIWDKDVIMEAFQAAIEAMEAPELIRCKDCRYHHVCQRGNIAMNEKGYCSDARPKRAEDDPAPHWVRVK